MLNENIILSVKNICKKYTTSKKDELNEFWALKNISFDLEKGKVLGIIGGNGAGKSTLLKILSEVIPPTSGTIEYEGNILSILEIGTGFHPDLSGYDNIFLNASLLGMSKEQTLLSINDIIEFSGIKDFIYEAVKTYSSGMYLRLALSIALFTDNQILLLDEVVSVGDAEFRYKAIQKIKDLVASGKTCIVISHDLNSVSSLCDSCLLLNKGEVIFYGKTKSAIEDYTNKINTKINNLDIGKKENNKCKFISASLTKNIYSINESVKINIKYEKHIEDEIDIVINVKDYNAIIMSDCAIYRPDYIAKNSPIGVYETTCSLPANIFNNGNFFIDLLFGDKTSSIFQINSALRFTVELPEWEREKKWVESADNIPFRPICNWETIQINL